MCPPHFILPLSVDKNKQTRCFTIVNKMKKTFCIILFHFLQNLKALFLVLSFFSMCEFLLLFVRKLKSLDLSFLADVSF